MVEEQKLIKIQKINSQFNLIEKIKFLMKNISHQSFCEMPGVIYDMYRHSTSKEERLHLCMSLANLFEKA